MGTLKTRQSLMFTRGTIVLSMACARILSAINSTYLDYRSQISEMEGEESEKYSSEMFDYLVHRKYAPDADKVYKHGLRKRSRFFVHEEGRLYYVGGGKAVKRLVVIGAEERERIVSSIHDEGHL